MRLWSLHPKYLDSIGLVALWRESLLAQKVLQGNTKGYRNHPQIFRFRDHPRPVVAIANYLIAVWKESVRRGYKFDKGKITATELFTSFKNNLNLKLNLNQFKRIWCSCFIGLNKYR